MQTDVRRRMNVSLQQPASLGRIFVCETWRLLIDLDLLLSRAEVSYKPLLEWKYLFLNQGSKNVILFLSVKFGARREGQRSGNELISIFTKFLIIIRIL